VLELVVARALLLLLPLLVLLPKVDDVVLPAAVVDPGPILENDNAEVVELEDPDLTTTR
jgi:hypothetical protein